VKPTLVRLCDAISAHLVTPNSQASAVTGVPAPCGSESYQISFQIANPLTERDVKKLGRGQKSQRQQIIIACVLADGLQWIRDGLVLVVHINSIFRYGLSRLECER
jgi:hypothetical protein